MECVENTKKFHFNTSGVRLSLSFVDMGGLQSDHVRICISRTNKVGNLLLEEGASFFLNGSLSEIDRFLAKLASQVRETRYDLEKKIEVQEA